MSDDTHSTPQQAAPAPSSSSADRARFWAGLNRYLRTEAEHAHRRARHDREVPVPREATGRVADPEDH